MLEYFVQSGDDTVQIDTAALCKLAERNETDLIVKQFETLKDNEYMLVAYYDGHVLGREGRKLSPELSITFKYNII